MATILYNPTNEDFIGQHMGEHVHIPANSELKVDEARGRHLLNFLGPRGLTFLEYGDDSSGAKELKAKNARKTNKEFKLRHINNFNARNEQRKQQGLEFEPPTDIEKKYAEELDVDLFQSYAVVNEDKLENRKIREENEALRAEVSELRGLMTQVLSKLEGVPATEPKAVIDNMTKKQLLEYIEEHELDVKDSDWGNVGELKECVKKAQKKE